MINDFAAFATSLLHSEAAINFHRDSGVGGVASLSCKVWGFMGDDIGKLGSTS